MRLFKLTTEACLSLAPFPSMSFPTPAEDKDEARPVLSRSEIRLLTHEESPTDGSVQGDVYPDPGTPPCHEEQPTVIPALEQALMDAPLSPGSPGHTPPQGADTATP